jgi:hypothetical protein
VVFIFCQLSKYSSDNFNNTIISLILQSVTITQTPIHLRRAYPHNYGKHEKVIQITESVSARLCIIPQWSSLCSRLNPFTRTTQHSHCARGCCWSARNYRKCGLDCALTRNCFARLRKSFMRVVAWASYTRKFTTREMCAHRLGEKVLHTAF